MSIERIALRQSLLALVLVLTMGGGSPLARADEDTPICRPASPEAVIQSEELLEKLRRPLSFLSVSAHKGRLPDVTSRIWFEDAVSVRDIAEKPDASKSLGSVEARLTNWPVASDSAMIDSHELELFSALFVRVKAFHHFGFYNIRGCYGADDAFETLTGFKGLAELEGGALLHIKGSVDIRWVPSDHAACSDTKYRIGAFHTRRLTLMETDELLFEDVLPSWLGEDEHERLVRSGRDERLADWILTMRAKENAFEESLPSIFAGHVAGTDLIEGGQVAVVDVDGDGHDDFYVVGAREKGLFYRNRGNGAFEEIGSELGLDIPDVYAVAFADFDNDGDKDAFVSFLQEGTRYLVQEDGRFVSRNVKVAGGLPSWVSCISVADYDNDGLLDVYFGAYAGIPIAAIAADREKAAKAGKPVDMSFPGLDATRGAELVRRLLDEKADPVLARPGPPNRLLKNFGGGRFGPAPACENLEIYLNTMAVTWADVDGDGDQDLYVTNEGGPNQLMRNKGDGTFEEVSDEVAGEVGFGMGAAFGDYDGDGDLDLYVTNMYSKAGLRISSQLRASPKIAASARGNSLIRNDGAAFRRIEDTPVESADFGWGGAFVDFDNDGRLDIYAPAGYVTVPEEVAIIGDT